MRILLRYRVTELWVPLVAWLGFPFVPSAPTPAAWTVRRKPQWAVETRLERSSHPFTMRFSLAAFRFTKSLSVLIA